MRFVKLLAWTVVVLAVGLAASIAFTIGWRPFIGPRARTLTARKVESTPARLARGEYLVNSVTDCMSCHPSTTGRRTMRGWYRVRWARART